MIVVRYCRLPINSNSRLFPPFFLCSSRFPSLGGSPGPTPPPLARLCAMTGCVSLCVCECVGGWLAAGRPVHGTL